MQPHATTAPTEVSEAGWLRLHQAFMPDYNRKTTVYWWAMVLAGVAILAHTLRTLSVLPTADLVQIGVGAAIAMLAGVFPVRIPRSTNSFAAGEIFIFLLLLLHGPEAATLAAAGEGADRLLAHLQALDQPHHQSGIGVHCDVRHRLAAAGRHRRRPGPAEPRLVAVGHACCARCCTSCSTRR